MPDCDAARSPVHPCRGGEMADAADLKSAPRKGVWVRIPPPAPFPTRFLLTILAKCDINIREVWLRAW